MPEYRWTSPWEVCYTCLRCITLADCTEPEALLLLDMPSGDRDSFDHTLTPFLQDLEVTVTLSDKPGLFGGAKAEEVVASAASTSRSETGGVTTITSFEPSHHSSSTGAEGEAPPADLPGILPADEAFVYGGKGRAAH